MRSLIIATASALFFAYLITELFTRLWQGNYLALLVLAFVALLLSGLLNLKLAGWLDAGRAAAPEGPRRRRDTAQEPRRRRQPRQGSAGRRDKQTDGEPRRPAASRAPAAAQAASGPRETGTVKWFNRTKGFGFVIRESGEEIFVHQRSIRATGEGDERRRPTLRDGQSVTFVVAEREKGLQAEDVVPAEQ